MKRMSWLVGPAALAFAALCIHAQDVPNGWKVLKDKQGTCQMAVPSDWTTSAIAPSLANSPDNQSTAVVHGVSADQSFAEAKEMAKQVVKPTTIIEDSAKRLWYVYEGNRSGVTNWYVAVPGKPVCAAQITFKAAAMEDTAKKIVMSVAPAK